MNKKETAGKEEGIQGNRADVSSPAGSSIATPFTAWSKVGSLLSPFQRASWQGRWHALPIIVGSSHVLKHVAMLKLLLN